MSAEHIEPESTSSSSHDDSKAQQQGSGFIRVGFIGNSIFYYNDCPRLLEHMLRHSYEGGVVQDSCLRGGASLVSILEKGNGMEEKFGTPNAKREDGTYDTGAATVRELLAEEPWDFLILNDHTQAPARTETRDKTIRALKDTYTKLIPLADGDGNNNTASRNASRAA